MSVSRATMLLTIVALPEAFGLLLTTGAPVRTAMWQAAAVGQSRARSQMFFMQAVETKKSQAVETKKPLAITEQDIYTVQRKWADAVVSIGETFSSGGDYVTAALDAAFDLYAFKERGTILFKPTRCRDVPFRPTPEDALSYFIGAEHGNKYPEDTGFAIQPWSAVNFETHGFDVNGDTAIAMGHYFFTDAHTKAITKVEYTFGYRKYNEGVKIILQHSSVPFNPDPAPAKHPKVVVAENGQPKSISINISL
eukprot:1295904-Pleurochrysis_carterae.AAC.1